MEDIVLFLPLVEMSDMFPYPNCLALKSQIRKVSVSLHQTLLTYSPPSFSILHTFYKKVNCFSFWFFCDFLSPGNSMNY